MLFKFIGSIIVLFSSLASVTLIYEILVLNHVFVNDYHIVYFLLLGLFASLLPLLIVNSNKNRQ